MCVPARRRATRVRPEILRRGVCESGLPECVRWKATVSCAACPCAARAAMLCGLVVQTARRVQPCQASHALSAATLQAREVFMDTPTMASADYTILTLGDNDATMRWCASLPPPTPPPRWAAPRRTRHQHCPRAPIVVRVGAGSWSPRAARRSRMPPRGTRSVIFAPSTRPRWPCWRTAPFRWAPPCSPPCVRSSAPHTHTHT